MCLDDALALYKPASSTMRSENAEKGMLVGKLALGSPKRDATLEIRGQSVLISCILCKVHGTALVREWGPKGLDCL